MAAFVFNRLQYESGDWDLVDQRMPSNLLDSLAAYTTIDFDPHEAVVPLGSKEVLAAPFVYLSGHKLVQFTDRERENFEAYARRGGFVFADDCNHDIDGLFARSFEAQMAAIFGPDALKKIPNDHPIYRAFFPFEKGPPTTSFELNGWGDDFGPRLPARHRDRRTDRRALQQQGLRLRVGLRFPQQAVSGRGQHEVRGKHHCPRHDFMTARGLEGTSGQTAHDHTLRRVSRLTGT